MSSAEFTPLADFALLEISGPDSERFLQGQLTCDVVKLPLNHWILGACCNAKGRMVANFVIAKLDNGFWLRLPRVQVEVLTQHLSRYIVFFKAQMIAHLDDWTVVGRLNLPQTKLLEAALPVTLAPAITLCWPDGREEQWLPESITAAANSQWASTDIDLGLVWVTPDTTLQWLPQELNWPEHGGVSFQKGCYTGQEIVARLQYLGKSKKHLVTIHSTNDLKLSPLNNLSQNEQNVGTIAAWQSNKGVAILNSIELHNPLQCDTAQLYWAPFDYQVTE